MYQPARLPSLDGWRAVAIAMVILSHFTATRGFHEPWWWTQIFQGNLGVRIFFVISGLLITWLLLVEADRNGRPSLREFYSRRVLRIFPVYFLYLTVLLGLAGVGLYSDTMSAWVASFTFTRNLVGHADSLTGHYWSLSVEEQFYVVWPVILVALRLWERPRVAIALLLVPIVLCPLFRSGLVQAWWPHPWVIRGLNNFSTTIYADSLAVGCLGAFFFRVYRWHIERFSSPAILVLASAVFIAAAAGGGRAGALEPFIPLIEAIAILCVMLVTIERRKGILYWVLNTKAAVWLGVLSYSLYVWQQLFISWSAGPRLSTLPVYSWRVWWLAALACACASYYIVERPILKLRDQFRKGVERPRAVRSFMSLVG